MKEVYDAIKYNALLLLLFVIIVVIMPMIIVGSFYEADREQQGVARCKSLQGEYGGGKCFKDGKEV